MLTEREQQVMNLISEGLKQKEISKKLKISQPAVSGLYTNALRKLRDAKEMIVLAKERGWTV